MGPIGLGSPLWPFVGIRDHQISEELPQEAWIVGSQHIVVGSRASVKPRAIQSANNILISDAPRTTDLSMGRINLLNRRSPMRSVQRESKDVDVT